jgi:hypothetical protein
MIGLHSKQAVVSLPACRGAHECLSGQ